VNALAVLSWRDNDKEATVIWLFGRKEENHATTEISQIQTIKNVGIKNYNKCIITNDEPNQIY
jgi:hypothetical protein